MCGMWRTGYLYACEEDDVAPDMLTIAKGLGAGYQPIGATLVSQRIYDAIYHGSGFFQHGHTYMGHPAACAAGLAVQHVIRDDHLLENVRSMGGKLRSALKSRFGNNPHVGDIRGRGLFIGMELVADQVSKEPFEPSQKLNVAIKKEAARGLMVYPMGARSMASAATMSFGTFIHYRQSHISEIVGTLGEAVDAALAA